MDSLVELVGKRLTGDFMWMFEVVLNDGTPVQAYKHIDTRRYVHLAADWAAFVYEPPTDTASFPRRTGSREQGVGPRDTPPSV